MFRAKIEGHKFREEYIINFTSENSFSDIQLTYVWVFSWDLTSLIIYYVYVLVTFQQPATTTATVPGQR